MLQKILPLLVLCFCVSSAQTNPKADDSIVNKFRNAQILSSEDPEKATAVLKELKKEAEAVGHKKVMAAISRTLILLYYDAGDYKKTIEEGRYAEKVAMELQEMEPLSDVYRMRGIAYQQMHFPEESLKELQKALKYAKKISKPTRRYYILSLVYESFAGNYVEQGNAKKEIEYRLKSIKASKNISESEEDPIMLQGKYYSLAYQYANLGIKYNELKIKDSALFYFEEGLKIHENGKCDVYSDEKAKLLSGLAAYYVSTKQFRKSIQLAKRAEVLEKQVGGLPYARKRIYEALFNSYVETDRHDSSKYYLKLYTALNDSILKVEKASLYTPVKQIINDKEKENTSKVRNIIIAGIILLVLLLLLGWCFWRRKNSRIQKNYESLIEKLKSEKIFPSVVEEEADMGIKVPDELNIPEEDNNDAKVKPLTINNSTVNMLLYKLEKFERSNRYIKKELSLTYLASHLDTNTKYLSEVIKQHRGKTYNNYMNGLRIDYIVRLLFREPKVREYKISYLAELCGFSSREVFAVIFKKETGFTPSFYIHSLKKNETGDRNAG